jgi:hypothetical protein
MTVTKDVARYARVMNPEPGRERISEPMMGEFRMSLSKMLNILQYTRTRYRRKLLWDVPNEIQERDEGNVRKIYLDLMSDRTRGVPMDPCGTVCFNECVMQHHITAPFKKGSFAHPTNDNALHRGLNK